MNVKLGTCDNMMKIKMWMHFGSERTNTSLLVQATKLAFSKPPARAADLAIRETNCNKAKHRMNVRLCMHDSSIMIHIWIHLWSERTTKSLHVHTSKLALYSLAVRQVLSYTAETNCNKAKHRMNVKLCKYDNGIKIKIWIHLWSERDH